MTALKELLWGPPAATNIGYTTAFPTPQEVLTYPGRQANWGPGVTLRHLEIARGVATVEFSKELKAYGGTSSRMALIKQQVSQTLQQFPGISKVHLSIEGEGK
jgi:spore germination protein GerM